MYSQDQFKNEWNKFRGVVQQNFDELTAEDIAAINGKRDVLISKIQSRYGISAKDAEAKLNVVETQISGKGPVAGSNPASRGLKDSAPKGGIQGAKPGVNPSNFGKDQFKGKKSNH